MSSIRLAIEQLLADGVSRAEAARRLGVAPSTVDHHVRRLAADPASGPGRPPPEPARRQVGTRDAVAELLAQGVGRLEIARRLGVSRSTVSYHARRLGAPVDDRGARRYDWAAVQRFYDEGHTVAECVAAFGFSKESWHAAKRRGDVVTRPRRLTIAELCVRGVHRDRYALRRRLLEAGLKEERCERCGLEEWLGAPVPLALHHVNGERDDNRLENLQLLCHNCHAQTDNFSGRGRRKAEVISLGTARRSA